MMDWAVGQEQDPGLWMLGTDDSGHWATKLWSGNAKSCAFGRRSSAPGVRTLYGGVEPAGKLGACLKDVAPSSGWPRPEHEVPAWSRLPVECLRGFLSQDRHMLVHRTR